MPNQDMQKLIKPENISIKRNLIVVSSASGACAFQGEMESVRTGGKPTIIIGGRSANARDVLTGLVVVRCCEVVCVISLYS